MKKLLFKFWMALMFISFLANSVAFSQATLIHSYDFEDGTANDGTGTLNGTVTGTVTFADGKCTVDPAANGAGQDYGYVSFDGAALALSGYTSITTEAYIIAGNGTNDWYTMLYYFGDNAANYLFSQMTQGNTNANVKTITTGGEVGALNGSVIDDGAAHHIVAVVTSTSLSFYVDGKLKQTSPGTGFITPIGTTFANLFRGPDAWTDDNWIGSFEAFNIYEGAMDAATIAYNADTFLIPSVSALDNISLSAGTLVPVFSSGTLNYTAVLPGGTTSVTPTVTKTSAASTVSGDGAIDVSSGSGTSTILVTAFDNTTTTYTINYTVTTASSDATLSDLQVDGATVAGFDAGTTVYYIALADAASTLPNVTATANDVNATSVVVTQATSVGGTATVLVTAEDGATKETYTIIFITKQHAYTFETNANDLIGTVNGTLEGTASVSGGVLVLDGNGDFLSFDGTVLALDAYESITMEYGYRSSQGANSGWNWSSYFGNNGGADNLRIGFNTNDKILVNYSGNELSRAEVDDGSYHHLVVVLTGSKISYYLDGVFQSESAVTGFTIGAAEAYLGKGSNNWADPTWLGDISDFYIYEGEMGATTISSIAYDYLNSNNADLSGLSVDVGTLTPAFNVGTTHYALEVSSATTTVNLTATPAVVGVGVTGDGAIDISGGETTASVLITALDGITTKTYSVDIMFEDPTCFVPLYNDRTNFVPDSEITDLSLFSGWGNKTIIYGLDAYCGPTSGKISGNNGGSIDLNFAANAIKANTYYRMKAMVKVVSVGQFQIGFDGVGMPSQSFKTKTLDAWEAIDTLIVTGATVATNISMYFNNYGLGADVGYIDNWEMYEISSDTTLSDLTVAGTTVDGFDTTTYSYNVVLATGTTNVPEVIATTTDTNAKSIVTAATALPGSTTIHVTAEDGISTSTYTINFTVEPPILSDDATLSDLLVTGTTVDGFNAATISYDVVLAAGTTNVPEVTATTTDTNANAVVTAATALPGSTTVNVTAEDGISTSIYTINFTVEPLILSDDATLSDLLVTGTTVDGFNAATIVYNVQLAAGTTVAPKVTATTTDAKASAVVTDATSLPGSATVVVTAEDGTLKTYTINFTVGTTAVSYAEGDVIQVYPTISNDDFTVITDMESNVITVLDIKGEVILKKISSSSKQIISIPNPGMYIIQVTGKNKTASFRVLKTK